MSSDAMIRLSDVWKKYSTKDIFHKSLREELSQAFKRKDAGGLGESEFWALKGVNIEIGKGECVGLFGHNGAGKTTILKLIASVTYPNLGTVEVNGRVAPLISVGAGFHPDLTGRENIYTNGTIIGMTIKEVKENMEKIIEFSDIDRKFLDMPVKKYSDGMSARLGFSIAVHSSADIILIDEILAVGDEAFQEKCLSKIRELSSGGKTVLIVSHNRPRMEELADRIIYVRSGEIYTS